MPAKNMYELLDEADTAKAFRVYWSCFYTFHLIPFAKVSDSTRELGGFLQA